MGTPSRSASPGPGEGTGFADVWKRGFFAQEYKGKDKDMRAAYVQLMGYKDDLDNPPLLIVSDIERIEIHTNFTGLKPVVTTITLDELASDDPSLAPFDLRDVFAAQEEFRPRPRRPRVSGACHHSSVMKITLAGENDHQAIIDIAGRTWLTVFTAVNEVLGQELALRLHGADWRQHHAAELRELLTSQAVSTWVAEVNEHVVGFVCARVADPGRRIGEIAIVGVDPTAQRVGVGAALTTHAEAWLRQQGMAVVYIGTGGDDGHAPARRLYEALGYRPFPVVQYYKVIK